MENQISVHARLCNLYAAFSTDQKVEIENAYEDLVKKGLRTNLAPRVGEKRTFLLAPLCTLNKK